MTLTESHTELLGFVIAKRVCFYGRCSNDDGTITDEIDQQELDEMDAIIDRAIAVQGATT